MLAAKVGDRALDALVQRCCADLQAVQCKQLSATAVRLGDTHLGYGEVLLLELVVEELHEVLVLPAVPHTITVAIGIGH